jgi:hypothetical protein
MTQNSYDCRTSSSCGNPEAGQGEVANPRPIVATQKENDSAVGAFRTSQKFDERCKTFVTPIVGS